MPRFMAELSVGQSADGSVADTTSALAPLAIAAWMAGIWEDGVASVPLVSLPVSPRALSAASAPPEFTLSEVVKYGLPRFFGMTKTFRPFFSPPAALEPPPDADPELLLPELLVLLEELQAASMADATSTAIEPSTALVPGYLLAGDLCPIPESFQSSRQRCRVYAMPNGVRRASVG